MVAFPTDFSRQRFPAKVQALHDDAWFQYDVMFALRFKFDRKNTIGSVRESGVEDDAVSTDRLRANGKLDRQTASKDGRLSLRLQVHHSLQNAAQTGVNAHLFMQACFLRFPTGAAATDEYGVSFVQRHFSERLKRTHVARDVR